MRVRTVNEQLRKTNKSRGDQVKKGLTDSYRVAVLNLVDRDIIVVDTRCRGIDAGESGQFAARGRRCILARTGTAISPIVVFGCMLRIDRRQSWSRERVID